MRRRKVKTTAIVLQLEYRPIPITRILVSSCRNGPQDDEDTFIQNYLSLADAALKQAAPPTCGDND
ncbi:MAG TPA: hypothetical protein VGR48_15465 [Terriglobales bacterium]|nr:hypothetical protein [Terriglobales bacterium]